MAFGNMFKDKNDINEKSVIGFAAFVVMVLAMVVDLVTGYIGKDLIINQFIYDSFLVICLGSLGIGSVDKFINKKDDKKEEEEEG